MFDNIIAYSIKHKFVIGLLVLILVGVGMYSLKKLPIDALPDITNNQVQIITTSPNLATQEVELFITYPIELAVKSIPDIIELRSISRFGLSLVTVVFEEDTDIYWARNQINERLSQAKEQIPQGYGTPELAPISTGLGEIYQYTVSATDDVKYDIMALRSIQDWIIIPQLLGIRGIAEVNTLGGVLKEYEVAVDPDRLKSMNVTMVEIFKALQQNNENTGGAYIDKKPNAYFIRSIGMVNSLEDISKIVIKNKNNIPILIRDVAKVQFGSSIRYGATTKDGKGEVVSGMVMMLKGANSAEIVTLVKDKIEHIKTTLPDGVSIEPFLDRSKLVGRAISTVKTNLIEGALIVIFILVLLIGNWRAGLIVATVIPLALLFAVSMMRLFGVSGNLMSLGAIDFGLIVDGAVIIVEAIVHRLQSSKGGNKLSVGEMDKQVYTAASKIRSSAAFGEIIILIVYLPILALVGIEGKMFKPMAQTVSFAILGAFILSLTYVPMMCALFLEKKTGHKPNLSDKIIAFFQKIYTPFLNFALKAKILVLAIAVALFAIALVVFNGLGGEFIPTLQEGDIATHIMIPPGSSLEQEIETTLKAEKMLMDNFPEVLQAVSKIGSAETPTDPMPMEVADLMIIMKEKSEWTSAYTYEEMIDKMEHILNDLPGVTTEFSQPIQMRFNELMTGVRSDVGVKIFGEDIDLLVSLGEEAVNIVNQIEGIQDARAESVVGLKQITVKYNKDKLALYGLQVGDLNQVIRMGFAGEKAGAVYEGEKKYDLVVRLSHEHRQDIRNIRNLYVTLPSGNQIPMDQVADINYERGPSQISREEGKRRIIIGFNVRGRDVQSVVNEVKSKLKTQLNLPVGYYLSYAGQFENLVEANKRLSIAVPIALALIFVMLYFTFKSIAQSLLIFTAIPLSAIGGIFALWMRDMPFSISAGVGFIALFGVAVLNGIVLISYFNQLKEEGMTDVIERIKVGTRVRLRPVIMTASVASLGFLPMALSTSAGAEVQTPLATVVIGGLLSATLLTLIILPILYYYLEKVTTPKISKSLGMVIVILGSMSLHIDAQNTSFTLQQTLDMTLRNNGLVTAAKLNIEKQQQSNSSIYMIPKADIEASIGQINGRYIDQSYSISQRYNPFLSKASSATAQQRVLLSEIDYRNTKNRLTYQIKDEWNTLQYYISMSKLLEEQNEIWNTFAEYSALKYKLGESNKIEQSTAQIRNQMILQLILEIKSERALKEGVLKSIARIPMDSNLEAEELIPMDLDILLSSNLDNNIILASSLQQIEIAKSEKDITVAESKPDFMLGYAIQSIRGVQEADDIIYDYNAVPRFHTVNLGISLPIFGKRYKAATHAADLDIYIQEAGSEQLRIQLEYEILQLQNQYGIQQNMLNHYTTKVIPNAELIVGNAKKLYDAGNIGYLEYVQALDIQKTVKEAYFNTVKDYNHTIITLLYLSAQ